MSNKNKELMNLARLFKDNIKIAFESGDDKKVEKEIFIALKAVETKIREESVERAFSYANSVKESLKY